MPDIMTDVDIYKFAVRVRDNKNPNMTAKRVLNVLVSKFLGFNMITDEQRKEIQAAVAMIPDPVKEEPKAKERKPVGPRVTLCAPKINFNTKFVEQCKTPTNYKLPYVGVYVDREQGKIRFMFADQPIHAGMGHYHKLRCNYYESGKIVTLDALDLYAAYPELYDISKRKGKERRFVPVQEPVTCTTADLSLWTIKYK